MFLSSSSVRRGTHSLHTNRNNFVFSQTSIVKFVLKKLRNKMLLKVIKITKKFIHINGHSQKHAVGWISFQKLDSKGMSYFFLLLDLTYFG